MWLLIITAIIIAAFFIAYELDESVCDTLPVTCGGFIFVLYAFAMLRGMQIIYAFSLLMILEIAVKAVKAVKNDGTGEVRQKLFKLISPAPIAFVVIMAAITYLTKDQIFTWWDDINFWSSDAKQIFYLDGFPGKYGNVSPEFGDYPPVTSLFKWIFLQISMREYKEGLQFAGYYALNAVFLLPLLKTFDKKKNALSAISTAFIFLIPGIVNGIVFYGTPADITMGIVYGALLYAIWDREKHSDFFYFGRIAIYMAVLFLTKSVGIEWAAFAAIFYFVINGKSEKTRTKKALISMGCAFLVYASWLGFCLLNRRVAKSTGLGIKMVTGSYAVPSNALDKAKFFMLGMWTMPMHADHNITFDPSIGVILILIFTAIFVLCKTNLFEGKEKKKVTLFTVFTGLFTYGLIFFAHISLFQSEDQYLDAFAMTNSIARYGAPFVLGSMYLIIAAALKRADARSAENGTKTFTNVALIVAAFILLTTDYTGAYKALFGYRQKLDENRAYNEAMIDDGAGQFLAAISGNTNLWGHRVLNLRSDSFNHWVHDTYISKEASPVPVVYETLQKDDTQDSVAQKIRASHAEYIYIEKVAEDDENEKQRLATECFDNLMAQGESFEYNKVYSVERNGNDIILSAE